MLEENKRPPLRLGVGGPVGAGKTSLVKALCLEMRQKFNLAVITNDIYTREDAEFLLKIAFEYAAGRFVLGLPVNMNGTEGPRCQSVRQFASNFAEKTDLPIAFWDERLSTQAAERHLIASDVSRKRRAKVIDKLAAQFILQGALDFMRNIEH